MSGFTDQAREALGIANELRQERARQRLALVGANCATVEAALREPTPELASYRLRILLDCQGAQRRHPLSG